MNWTAKEAYVRALGEGLNKDLKSFEITVLVFVVLCLKLDD
ncbi:MAG TPA: 4'-phosphopantetheinyl transferase superfamily protein [Syntrophaceticus sp.]|nr:4'-phosphopantetheinyl transferase superfamily protein [Syntrophaceticus sp.]